MAQSVQPADIIVNGHVSIHFKAAFHKTYELNLENNSCHRIAYRVENSNPSAVAIEPQFGILALTEKVTINIACLDFSNGGSNDNIEVAWTNTPSHGRFNQEWFQGNGMIRRTVLKVAYHE